MAKIYLAGGYPVRARIAEIAEAIEARGHTIAYRWWADDAEPDHRSRAKLELKAIAGADALVAIEEGSGTGTATEIGYAYGRGIPVGIFLQMEGPGPQDWFRYRAATTWHVQVGPASCAAFVNGWLYLRAAVGRP